MAIKTIQVGLDAEGNVVEDFKDAVVVIETEYDDETGKLGRETIFRAEGKPLPQTHVVEPKKESKPEGK